MSAAPYPLLLRPILLEKVWGGRRLADLGKPLPTLDGKFGESWELADMPSTSASGAGGGAFHSPIRNGPLAGLTLADARARLADALLPGLSAQPHAPFPLLVKFLDAGENLSVQVHPSPAFARTHPAAHLKTECWHILAAQPGAVIYKGIRPEVSRAEFERLARAGDPRLVDTLCAISARPGECHNLPSGTVHALGAGVLVAEVQTPSDTTFRLFDWGRTGRSLHIDESLACASFPGEPGHDELLAGSTVAHAGPSDLCTRLVTTPFFIVDAVRVRTGDDITVARACDGSAACSAIILLDGSATLAARDGSFDPVPLARGDTCLIPFACTQSLRLHAHADTQLLRVRIPHPSRSIETLTSRP